MSIEQGIRHQPTTREEVSFKIGRDPKIDKEYKEKLLEDAQLHYTDMSREVFESFLEYDDAKIKTRADDLITLNTRSYIARAFPVDVDVKELDDFAEKVTFFHDAFPVYGPGSTTAHFLATNDLTNGVIIPSTNIQKDIKNDYNADIEVAIVKGSNTNIKGSGKNGELEIFVINPKGEISKDVLKQIIHDGRYSHVAFTPKGNTMEEINTNIEYLLRVAKSIGFKEIRGGFNKTGNVTSIFALTHNENPKNIKTFELRCEGDFQAILEKCKKEIFEKNEQ